MLPVMLSNYTYMMFPVIISGADSLCL
jgi:hypothetical protein